MNTALKFMEDIQTQIKKNKTVTVGSIVAAVVVICFCVGAALWYGYTSQGHVYILDQGSVLSAVRAENVAQRDLEARDHVLRFHQLFFNVAPDEEVVRANVEGLAIPLGDASVSNYYMTLRERGYFTSVIGKGTSKSIEVDSVYVDMSRHPYPAVATGYLYTVDAVVVTRQQFRSECRLRETGARTFNNPHGLLIENFNIRFGQAEEVRRKNTIIK